MFDIIQNIYRRQENVDKSDTIHRLDSVNITDTVDSMHMHRQGRQYRQYS